MKYLMFLLSLSLLSSCCKPEQTIKYLTEEDKYWLPYQVGDSLLFYEKEILISKTTIIHVGKGEIYNRSIEGCGWENSQTKNAQLKKITEFDNPLSLLIIGYNEENLCFGTYENTESSSSTSGLLKIDNSLTTEIEIDNTVYSDVKILQQNKGLIQRKFYLKKGIGLLKFTNHQGREFIIIKK